MIRVSKTSRKHAHIIWIPLNPTFISLNWGLHGVYIIFLILQKKNIDYGYSLEPPRLGGSNEYPQSMLWEEIWKIPEFFYLKNFCFGCKNFNIFE